MTTPMRHTGNRELSGFAGPRVLAGEPDERLVALARAGDERAFAAIVERYRAPLLRYVLGYLPPAAAEDALQQALINAYAALTGDTAKAPVTLRPWLYRVARNAALNVGRDPHAAFAPLPDGLDGVERPDEALQRSERLRAVVGAVRALPAKQRQVIVRHALDGDSHEQIAADLGVSAGAIRQLAHRARRTVREAAAAVIPVPLLRWLPWGSALAESPAGGGGAAGAKVAVAVVATAVAGGGAIEVARHERGPDARVVAARVAGPLARAAASPDGAAAARASAQEVVTVIRGGAGGGGGDVGSSGGGSGASGSGSSGSGSSGSGSSRSGSGGDSSGSGSSGSGSGGDSSGSGSSGSGSSGSDSSGSGSSGSGSSGSGSSGSGTSGSGTSGDGEVWQGDSSGSGSSELAAPTATPWPTSSGSGSSGSGGSGSGGSGSG